MRGRSQPQELTLLWLMFYGVHEFHMSHADLIGTTPGEMVDLINCLAIFKGVAKKKVKLTYDQIMMLR